MTQEDRLQHLLNIDDPQTEQEDKEFKKLFNSIVQDLKDFEELKNPVDEYETEEYLVHREAFYSDMAECLMYGYTTYKWNGEYYEREIPILKKSMKFKKWEEILHSTGSKKIELNDEYINHVIETIKIAKERKANEI